MSILNSNYQVDPNLKDETGFSAELGIRGHIEDIVSYDVSVFTIHYDDRIGIIPSPTTGKLTTTNVSQSRNYGIESFVELDIWKLIKGERCKNEIVGIFQFISPGCPLCKQ